MHSWLELENTLKWLQARDRGFAWVTIDSVTAAQEMLTAHITGEGFKANPSKRKDEDTMQLQDYLKRDTSTKKMINAFNDLPINVLWLAREIQEENSEGELVVRPAILGKMGTNDKAAMSRWLCGSVHAYGHLVVRTDKETKTEFRRLKFNRPVGKDRYGVLGPYIDNPTLLEIERRILLPVPAPSPRRRRTPTKESE